MGVRLLIRRARTVLNRFAADDAASASSVTPVEGTTVEESKRDPTTDTEVQQPEKPAEDLQHGVRDIEAITLTWSKKTLAFVFIKYVAATHSLFFRIVINTWSQQHLVLVLCQRLPILRLQQLESLHLQFLYCPLPVWCPYCHGRRVLSGGLHPRRKDYGYLGSCRRFPRYDLLRYPWFDSPGRLR